jgi:iron only hydrogenase large subunit-like protein
MTKKNEKCEFEDLPNKKNKKVEADEKEEDEERLLDQVLTTSRLVKTTRSESFFSDSGILQRLVSLFRSLHNERERERERD